jgi:hypothetical protein
MQVISSHDAWHTSHCCMAHVTLLRYALYAQVGELGNIGWREEENLRKQALEAAGITTATGPLPPAKDQAAAAAAAAAVSVTKKVGPVLRWCTHGVMCRAAVNNLCCMYSLGILHCRRSSSSLGCP